MAKRYNDNEVKEILSEYGYYMNKNILEEFYKTNISYV